MSVQNQTVKNVYQGNGSTTVFPYTFALNEDDGEHVGVYVTNYAGVSEATDNFTIDTVAKTVTYPTVGDPLPLGKKIVIRREIPNEQELNLENLGPFFAEDVEDEMDREVMMIQQLAEEVERSVKVDMASDHTPEEFLQDIADAVQTAKDYADEAEDSAEDADASVTKAAQWAEGSDAEVSDLGGTHSSKGWSDVSKGHSDNASGYSTAAAGSAAAAAGSETNAAYWAEGTDGQVAPRGGTHSAKGWAADSAASAASVVANVGKAATWAEGSDADVAVLGGEHSSKGWSDEAKAWAMSMANLPVATIIPWGGSSNTPPVGFLFCDGSAVSRTMYPDLFAAIGTTWGAGDGSTTFNLPRSEDLVMQGASALNPVGTYLQAGLPNITGEISNPNSAIVGGHQSSDSQSGSLIASDFTVPPWAGNSTTRSSAKTLSFDASQSNSIYGASDTVQPPAACVRYMIKAFDGQTADSALIDITQYAQDLANRLTREQTPAFNHRDVITTSGTYTAPVTGWYKITVKGGGGGGSGGYTAFAGAGGGEGGTTIAYEKLTVGDTAAIVVGAGGIGGKGGQGSAASGGNGGNSSVTVGSNTYTGGGGVGGYSPTDGNGGAGGTGTILGAAGSPGRKVSGGTGANGGGNGGGSGQYSASGGAGGISGGGGQGGYGPSSGSGYTAGGAGGDGYVWFEYFDPALM